MFDSTQQCWFPPTTTHFSQWHRFRRLSWRALPPKFMEPGSKATVSVYLSDDMGRDHPQPTRLPLSVHWGSLDDTLAAENYEVTIMGQQDGQEIDALAQFDPEQDALAQFDPEYDALAQYNDQHQDGSIGVTDNDGTELEIIMPQSCQAGASICVTIFAHPPSPSLPGGDHIQGRWDMGVAKTTIAASAMVQVGSCEDSSQQADAMRIVNFGNHSLRLYENISFGGFGVNETYGTVWDCGIILAAFLHTAKGRSLLNNATSGVAVDIGAGTGICGLALAQSDIDKKIILTDVENGLKLAKMNVEINLGNKLDKVDVTVDTLWWGRDEEAQITGEEPVSIVLASDVIYDEDGASALCTTLGKLCATNTLCLLGFRNRTSAAVIRSTFEKLKHLGFETSSIPTSELHPAYQSDDAHIIRLQRR